MKNKIKILSISAVAILCLLSSTSRLDTYDAHYLRVNNRINTNKEIKNVILFIGDGMGPTHVDAASVKKGEPLCFWDKDNPKWTYHGYVNTDSLTSDGFYLDQSKSLLNPKDNKTLYDSASSPYGSSGNYQSSTCYTDSAAAGTALATGYKTTNASIGISPLGEELTNIVSIATGLGKKAGVVSTDVLSGATPSSFLSHASERHMADELIKGAIDSNANIIMAGEPDEWNDTYVSSYTKEGYNVAYDFSKSDKNSEKEIILFPSLLAGSSLNPSLADLTIYALDKLDNEEGFFLMVEGANIDKASHANQAGTMIRETLDFEEAVEVAASWSDARDDTLIIVTADHETGAIYFDKDKANSSNIYDEVKFLSYNHSRTRVPISVYGDASEFFTTYSEELKRQGPLDKGLLTQHPNYIDNTDIFKLCVSYL